MDHKIYAQPPFSLVHYTMSETDYYLSCHNHTWLGKFRGWWSLRKHLQTIQFGSYILRENSFKRRYRFHTSKPTLFIEGNLTHSQWQWLSHYLTTDQFIIGANVIWRGYITAKQAYDMVMLLNAPNPTKKGYWPYYVDLDISHHGIVDLHKKLNLPIQATGTLKKTLEQNDEDFVVFLQVTYWLRLRNLLYKQIIHCRFYLTKDQLKISRPFMQERSSIVAYLFALENRWKTCNEMLLTLSAKKLGNQALEHLKNLRSWNNCFLQELKGCHVLLNRSFLISDSHREKEQQYWVLACLGVLETTWLTQENTRESKTKAVKKAYQLRARLLHSDKQNNKNNKPLPLVDNKDTDSNIKLLNRAKEMLDNILTYKTAAITLTGNEYDTFRLAYKRNIFIQWDIQQKQQKIPIDTQPIFDPENRIRSYSLYLASFKSLEESIYASLANITAYQTLWREKATLLAWHHWIQDHFFTQQAHAKLLADYLKKRATLLKKEGQLFKKDSQLYRFHITKKNQALQHWINRKRHEHLPETILSLEQRLIFAKNLLNDYGNVKVHWYGRLFSPRGKTIQQYIKQRGLSGEKGKIALRKPLWFVNRKARLLTKHYIDLQIAISNMETIIKNKPQSEQKNDNANSHLQTVIAKTKEKMPYHHRCYQLVAKLDKLFPLAKKELNSEFEALKEDILSNRKHTENLLAEKNDMDRDEEKNQTYYTFNFSSDEESEDDEALPTFIIDSSSENEDENRTQSKNELQENNKKQVIKLAKKLDNGLKKTIDLRNKEDILLEARINLSIYQLIDLVNKRLPVFQYGDAYTIAIKKTLIYYHLYFFQKNPFAITLKKITNTADIDKIEKSDLCYFSTNIHDEILYNKDMDKLQTQLISLLPPSPNRGMNSEYLFRILLNDFHFKTQDFNKMRSDEKKQHNLLHIQDIIKEIALIHYKHQSQCDIAQSCTELMIELTQHMLAIANGNDIGDSVQLALEHIERHNNDFQNTLATYKPDLMTLVENSEKNKLEEGSSQHLFFSNHQKETAVESVLPISGVIELQKIIKKVTTQHPLEKNKRQQTIRIIDSLKNNINQAANDIQKPVALQYIKSLFIAINALSVDVDNDFFKKTVTKNLKKALIESCQTAAQCWLLGFTGIPLDKWQQSQYHLYKRWGRNTTVVYHQTTLNFAAINSLLDKHLRTSPKLLGSKDFINDVKHLQKTVFPQLMEERARLNNWKEQPKANYCRFM